MNKNPQTNRFWRILGPILGYFGIQFLAQFFVQMGIMMAHIQEIAAVMQGADAMTYSEMMTELTVKLAGWMVEYQGLIAGFVALFTLPLPFFLYRRDRKLEQALKLPVNKKAPMKKYGWILLFGVAFGLASNVLIVMSGLAMKDTSYLNVSKTLYSQGMGVMLLCQGILVPLTEEWMFRGVLYRRCREQMPFWSAAFSVSLLFAFMHGSITQLTYTLVLGLFLAYVYEKFGSLKAPILLHMVLNCLSVVITKENILLWICSDMMRMSVSVIICAFLGALAFVEIRKLQEKPDVVIPENVEP